ncbi:hypothetical protein LSTR_LSTR017244 [Laodelphax striatellus]|uniref:Uncharacterized protein n=1 Tax=Laodelphax striatellus TaxID=195883 RepID=A0A482WVK0_LAOST|nr:hypothetical protein LSTR_LSTR017244 [Laodelphax striatellus]
MDQSWNTEHQLVLTAEPQPVPEPTSVHTPQLAATQLLQLELERRPDRQLQPETSMATLESLMVPTATMTVYSM